MDCTTRKQTNIVGLCEDRMIHRRDFDLLRKLLIFVFGASVRWFVRLHIERSQRLAPHESRDEVRAPKAVRPFAKISVTKLQILTAKLSSFS